MATKKTRSQGAGTHTERIRRERGGHATGGSEPEYLSVDDMLVALRDEVLAVSRAAEMRTREITALVTDYARGKATAEETHKRFLQYSRRWGDAIPGITTVEGKTDEELFRESDDVRRQLRSPIKL